MDYDKRQYKNRTCTEIHHQPETLPHVIIMLSTDSAALISDSVLRRFNSPARSEVLTFDEQSKSCL